MPVAIVAAMTAISPMIVSTVTTTWPACVLQGQRANAGMPATLYTNWAGVCAMEVRWVMLRA